MANALDRTARAHQARGVFIVALALNVLVSVAKLICGFFTGSLSMVADGFHSVLDSSANVLGIVGLTVSSKPPDENHPYGHRKFEALAAIGISFLMFFASFEVLTEALHRLNSHEPHATAVPWFSYAIMVATTAINFGISKYETKMSSKLNNSLLAADAKHTLSDIYTSLTVVATLIAVQLHQPMLDLVGSIIIVFAILHAGYEVIMNHIGSLVDEAVFDPAYIKQLVMEVPGVSDCHKIRSRGFDDHVFLDLHVQVPKHLSIEEAHQISFNVEQRLREFAGDHLDVLVHVEDDNPPFEGRSESAHDHAH